MYMFIFRLDVNDSLLKFGTHERFSDILMGHNGSDSVPMSPRSDARNMPGYKTQLELVKQCTANR